VDPSFPAFGKVITTGAKVGSDYELVVWFSNGPSAASMESGLLDRHTGVVRNLETFSQEGHYDPHATNGGFRVVAQLDDRNGGVLDYGLFIGSPSRIVGQVGKSGAPFEAHRLTWSVNEHFVVFWASHPGSPIPADSGTYLTSQGATRFVAYRGGSQLGTSDNVPVHRADTSVNQLDQPQLGDTIQTGVPLAGGGTLVFWFVGAPGADSAILRAGRLVDGTRTVLKDLGVYHQPPFDIGFYHGWNDFDGLAGTHVLVGTYVGAAAKVVTGAPSAGAKSGYGRWTAHPTLIVFWASGVAAGDDPKSAAVAYDENDKVIGAFPCCTS
jgi:hypothetical protein